MMGSAQPTTAGKASHETHPTTDRARGASCYEPTKPERARRKTQPTDTEILADYKAFRTARYHIYVRPSDWARMTKRTKAAVLKIIDLAAQAVREGKL